ncbi:MAG: type VI secretion system ATPase TssH [Myxococcaceae bacterium]
MRVDPKALLRRLTPSCTRFLESALAKASSGFYEVTPEHLLRALLDDEKAEACALVAELKIDRSKLMDRIDRFLGDLRQGNAGRPVFAQSVFDWVEDAWLLASAERGELRLRSGVLFAQFILRQSRYSGEQYPDFENCTPDAVKRAFDTLASASSEAAEAVPSAGSERGAGPVPGAGALARFGSCLTARAREGKVDPVFGRHREVRQVVDILVRRRKNNPILVGEPGVGKTAIVEGLARAIVEGDVPEVLRGVELWSLDLGVLQAGAGVRGEFENRIKSVIDEVKASSQPIVLFIDEAHTLIGAGGNAGGGDAANLLKPALARGELRTIAATTWSEFKKYFEKDAALERRFQPVKVDEPSEEDAIGMLRGLRPLYESAHGVMIRDEAVVAAVHLSHRYLSSRQLPDKAVDLLDTAAARVKVALAARPEALTHIEQRVNALVRARDAQQREAQLGHAIDPQESQNVEQALQGAQDALATLKQRWETERRAVDVVHNARKERAQAKPNAAAGLDRSLQEAVAHLDSLQGEEPLMHAEVDADAVARVVASWTGIPVGKMKSAAIDTLLSLEKRLAERVRGQGAALKTVSEALQMATAGVRNPDAPLAVLLFVGPSGVGKTETALALADALYGGERFLTTINMSEFQEKHSVARLIGSPPGYVGYGEGGQLTEAVRQRPYSVVLLDECEKADLEVMNLFYQVFDKGTLNDGEGRTIDFRNTVVILTSNLGTDALAHLGASASPEQQITAVRPTLSKHFKPALLARMTVVPYSPVSQGVLREIVAMKLSAITARLQNAHRVKASFSPELIETLAERCLEGETGARAVEALLRGSLLPQLSRELLQRLVGERPPARVEVGVGPQNEWRIAFAEASI